VHNRAFLAKRLDAVYLPFLVHPGQLKDFFEMAEKLPVAGFSVTIAATSKRCCVIWISSIARAPHRSCEYGLAQGG
jgi:hypothetical protein